MRLAISNIAWDVAEDVNVALLLKRLGIDAIDVAPGKYFPDPVKATDKEITYVKDWWASQGIEMLGMQSLLFGTQGLNIFGDDSVRQAMLRHLAAVCRIGAGLGATRLVFGSPRNRDRAGLSDEQVMDISLSFFGQLGGIAQEYGVIFCLEPNPSRYGANFMLDSMETARVVRLINQPSIQMQLDTGALAINQEDPFEILNDMGSRIGHIHASEPDLVPIGDGATDHFRMAAAVRQYLPKHVVSIEMLATKNEPHMVAIERAISAARRYYVEGSVGENI